MTEWEADAIGAFERERPTTTREARVSTHDFVAGLLPDPYDGAGRLVTVRARHRAGWVVYVLFGWLPWALFRRRSAVPGKVWMLPAQVRRQRILTATPVVVWCTGYAGFLGGLLLESVPIFVGGWLLTIVGVLVAGVAYGLAVRGRIEDKGRTIRIMRLEPVAAQRWDRGA